MADQEPKTFDQWSIVEIMGHDRYAGRVTEQTVGGCAFVRIDVPECDGRPAFTKLFGQGAIFSITPVTEETARAAVKRFASRPLTVPMLEVRYNANGQTSSDFIYADEDYDPNEDINDAKTGADYLERNPLPEVQ